MQITYQSPLYLTEKEKTQIDIAMEGAGKFFRTCFNNFWFNKGSTYLELKKKEFCSQAPFFIGTKMANSLIKEAQAKVLMWQEALCYTEQVKAIKLEKLEKLEKKTIDFLEFNQEQAKLIRKNKSLNSFLKKDEGKLKAFNPYQKIVLRIKRLKSRLWSIHRKIEKIKAYFNKNKNGFSITFGSKQSQRELSLGKIDKKTWRRKRNNFLYGIGESDVKYGNNTIKLINQNQLQIELLNLEKIVVNTKTRPLHEKLLNKDFCDKKTARVIRKTIRGKDKYYVQFTVDLKTSKDTKDSTLLIIGTDLNKSFISVYVEAIKKDELRLKDTNANVLWKNYDYNNEGNTNQRKESLRKIIKTFIQEAKDICKNQDQEIILRIENLNFKTTKAKTKKASTEKGKAYNAMLHNLPYKMFKDLVIMEAYKSIGQIKVELINPKYSSQKALELGLDRHLGAAKVIAYGNGKLEI